MFAWPNQPPLHLHVRAERIEREQRRLIEMQPIAMQRLRSYCIGRRSVKCNRAFVGNRNQIECVRLRRAEWTPFEHQTIHASLSDVDEILGGVGKSSIDQLVTLRIDQAPVTIQPGAIRILKTAELVRLARRRRKRI